MDKWTVASIVVAIFTAFFVVGWIDKDVADREFCGRSLDGVPWDTKKDYEDALRACLNGRVVEK